MRRKMHSGSESDEEVQARPKTRKTSGSAATTKAVEKPRSKKTRKKVALSQPKEPSHQQLN